MVGIWNYDPYIRTDHPQYRTALYASPLFTEKLPRSSIRGEIWYGMESLVLI